MCTCVYAYTVLGNSTRFHSRARFNFDDYKKCILQKKKTCFEKTIRLIGVKKNERNAVE